MFVKTTKPGSYLHLRPEGDFNVFTYTFHATKKSWNDAQLTCEADGGNLASIHSAEENEIIKNMIGGYGNGRAHIGINDKQTEDTWTWSDGTAVGYTNWYPNEPNDAGAGEDCTHYGWPSQT